jgi:putative transposase
MHLIAGEFYHIYNRGNNKQLIFFTDDNYLFFLKKIREQLLPFADIVAYCLMPNHFHILIRATEQSTKERVSFGGKPMQEFAYRIGIMLSSYTQAVNKANKTSGSLFQQKTKAKLLAEEINNRQVSYLEYCFFYIHQNPLTAGLVKQLSDWKFSSYLDYSEKRNGTLCNKKLLFEYTGLTVTDIINRSETGIDPEIISKLE